MLDHGGLRGWVRQLSAAHPEDTLLLVHFDADAESWENFDQEIAAIADLVGDVADGNGDGFSSWAEKDFNHEIATVVATARDRALQAALLAGEDARLDEATVQRLLALSTTNYGLAAPFLHPDRVASARAYAGAALDLADAVVGDAPPPAAGTIEVVNARPSAGPALVEIPLDTSGSVAVHRDGVELPIVVGDGVVSLVLDLEAMSVTTLDYALDAPGERAGGGLSEADFVGAQGLLAPFTECLGAREEGASVGPVSPEVDGRGARVVQTLSYALPFCGDEGSVSVSQQVWAGLPGTLVEVRATMGEADEDAESVALSPIACEGTAETLAWRTFMGTDRERPVRSGVDAHNGMAADGVVAMRCSDGATIQIAHRVTDRSSLAFAPFRERGGQAILAPLGVLWGLGPSHDGRRTGGTGVGEVVSYTVGSQFRPQAPDWSGATVRYLLLVGEGMDAGTLDLFAHPPLVRVGE